MSSRAPVPVSVLMPVRNDATNLERSLPTVCWADEVWVVDSHSTDDTASVAEAHGARVAQFDFGGVWPKKKNWALDTLSFAHEWVFILDADETLPSGAEAEFRAIVSNPAEPHCGFWINRRFLFLDRWLHHAYYPNWNLRLFRHRTGRYERLAAGATASGDNEVHEHLVVNGPTGRLRCEMDHHAFPSVEVFVEKHNRYSNWEARVAVERGLQGSARRLQSGEAGMRRRLRGLSQTPFLTPLRPFARFAYVYFWQHGFLDGKPGFHFAMLHAFYEYLCIVKTGELKRRTTDATG